MTSPWPGVVPGVDASLVLVARLKVAYGGDQLQREIDREVEWGQRRPGRPGHSRFTVVPGKLPGAVGPPIKAWHDGRPARLWFAGGLMGRH